MTRRTALIVGVIVVVLVLAACAVVIWLLLPGPSLSVQAGPLPGRPGAAINVVGTRFPANKEIYVGLAAPNVPPTAGTSFVTTATDGQGRFNVAFPYPTDPNWIQLPEVVVYAGTPDGNAVATTRLQLGSIAWLLVTSTPVPTATALPTATATGVIVSSTPAPIPTIILQPTFGNPGSTIVVTGRGWRAYESLILSLLGFGAQIDATVNANAEGSFATTLVLPTDWGAPTATVLARSSDGALQATANYRVRLPVPTYSLTVTSGGNGTITNIGAPAVINCRATCSASFNQGTKVTLKAAPDRGYNFDAWSGCSGRETCVVTMDGDKSVTATFKPGYTLNTSVVGAGTISPTLDQPTYTYGQVVTLIAKPDPGWSFIRWSGACSGTRSQCTVKMDADKSVQAILGFNLAVTSPTGGTIKIAPGDINCPPSCSPNFEQNTSVTLTALPNKDYTFGGWSGIDDCTTDNPCTFTMDHARSVSATFPRRPYTLTIIVAGTGGGVVTPTVGVYPYAYTETVKLEAKADDSSTFAGWSGAGCTTALVKMDADRTCTATFNIKTFTIGATASANGSITPSGPQTVNYGASQTFTITPATGYDIADVGVDGDSKGALPTYTFPNVTANHTITATFKVH